MGYSLRVPGWRITEWLIWDGTSLSARWDLPPNATELYAHPNATSIAQQVGIAGDPFASELVNVAGDPMHAQLLITLQAQLREAFTGKGGGQGVADGGAKPPR
jgi:hypothetical protein